MAPTLEVLSDSRLRTVLTVLSLIGVCASASALELTFELPDKSRQCFHEVIEKGTKSTVEFQVVTGGEYDVDVRVEGPQKRELYKQVKQQYGSHTWTADVTGEYTACFSNEFSTFTHKLVYIDWQIGEEKPLPGTEDHATAMTMMENSAHEIHESLNKVDDFQTHHRLREAQGRKRAEDLNERVLVWSGFVTLAVLFVGFGQVMVLKSFFSDKKPAVAYAYH